MKRFALLLGLGILFVMAPAARAQDHIEVGLYGDYYRLSQTDTNFAGVGARLGVGVFPHVKLEGEMAYDFSQVITEGFTDSSGTVTFQRTNLHLLHGEFGPKFELGHGLMRPFVVLKGGFQHFSVSSCQVSFGCATSQIANIRANNTTGLLYPGGGIEGHIGPVGLRLDVGDEISFQGGTHNNLRVAFGPFIRF
jgi:hypothetical protein